MLLTLSIKLLTRYGVHYVEDTPQQSRWWVKIISLPYSWCQFSTPIAIQHITLTKENSIFLYLLIFACQKVMKNFRMSEDWVARASIEKSF